MREVAVAAEGAVPFCFYGESAGGGRGDGEEEDFEAEFGGETGESVGCLGGGWG